MRRVFALLALVLVSCSSDHGVLLTMSFDATVTDSALASVKTLLVRTSGDEAGSYPITPGRAVMRTERLVYRQAPATRSLSIEIDAVDAAGVLVATGTAGPISVEGTPSLSITLSAPHTSSNPDLGTNPDLGANPDLATPDMAKFYPSPVFVSGSLASHDGSSVTVAPPLGIDSSSVLLAMIGGVNTTTSTPVSFAAPTGWSMLTTVSAAAPNPATATWFWRDATASEPESYVFTRGDSGPMVAYVAAYEGTVDLGGGNGPFDDPAVSSGPSSTTATCPSTTVHAFNELVVLNGFAPDDLNGTWSEPSGYALRQSAEALSADVVTASYGSPVGGATSSLDAASRWLTFTVGVHGVSHP